MDSSQEPTRVNKCEGMWFAWAEAGAILAYRRVGAKAFFRQHRVVITMNDVVRNSR
jgi:hypothetical protein